MRAHVLNKKLTSKFHIDSAGTIAYHCGEPPDSRSQQEAQRNNVDMSNQIARQVTPSDFTDFNYIIAMDRDNLTSLNRGALKSNQIIVQPIFRY